MKKIIISVFLIPSLLFSSDLKITTFDEIAREISTQIKNLPENRIIAVLDFPYIDSETTIASVKIAESLAINLSKYGIKIVERNLISKILEEQKLQLSGAFNQEKITEIGNLTGANTVITGTIEDLENDITKINLRIIDVKTGIIITGNEYYIKREWNYHKLKSSKKITLDFDFNPQKIAKTELPDIEEIKSVKMDFSNINVDSLSKLNELINLEKNSTDYMIIAEKWEQLGMEYPEYMELAVKKSRKWKEYYEKLLKYEEEKKKQEQIIKEDYEKLLKILDINIIPVEKKFEYIEKFIQAYGEENLYSEKLKSYKNYYVCIDKSTDKMGFCYFDGTVAIKGDYDYALPFYEDLALVKKGNKRGYIDRNGKFVIPLTDKFELASVFSEGMAPVRINGKWGFINKSGKVVIKPKYTQVYPFKDGKAIVQKGRKWGVIDKNGKYIIKPKFYKLQEFSYSRAAFGIEGTEKFLDKKYETTYWGYIDEKGDIVIKPIYKEALPFNKYGTAFVKTGAFNHEMHLIDKNGNILFKSEGNRKITSLMYDERIRFKLYDTRVGYLDPFGNVVIKPEYSAGDFFSEGLALVKHPEKGWGFIDKNGNEVIPFGKYTACSEFIDNIFSEGVANVESKINYKCGYIDKNGNKVIDFKFEKAYPFKDERAIVEYMEDGQRKYGIIDKEGNILNKMGFDKIERTKSSVFIVKLNDKYGLINRNGKIILNSNYDYILEKNNNIFEAVISIKPKEEKRYYVDIWGRMIKAE